MLPLPCRVSRPGQAEVTLPPSFPQLSQPDFAWLMNCDGTQLQGCLCSFFFFFFFFPPSSTTGQGQSEQECETLLNSADGSQPSYQLARLHPLTHSGEHLKDPCCQDVRVAGRTASCLCFNTSSREQTTSPKKKNNLPGHDLRCTT